MTNEIPSTQLVNKADTCLTRLFDDTDYNIQADINFNPFALHFFCDVKAYNVFTCTSMK